MPLNVFISYAKEDEEKARQCYDQLDQEGVSPWLDVKKLLPGQNWEAEIDRAFKDANVIILLLSRASVTKRGFVQREANEAIERLRYKLPTDIYVIPLLLELCEVPSHIACRLQCLDINAPGAWDQVIKSLHLAAEQQSIEFAHGKTIGPFRIYTESVEDSWEGLPGHAIEIDYPRFVCSSRSEIAMELSTFFAGRAYTTLTQSRQKPWDQSPENFTLESINTAMNVRWEHYNVVYANERILSLIYDVGWYYSGAAHANSDYITYNFAVLERLYRLDLEDFFLSETKAIKRISEICIPELSREHWRRTGVRPNEGEIDWFAKGAGADLKNFSAFTISSDSFSFLFPPYQVSSYAMGQWTVDVSFYDLMDCLRPDGPHLLAFTPVDQSKSKRRTN